MSINNCIALALTDIVPKRSEINNNNNNENNDIAEVDLREQSSNQLLINTNNNSNNNFNLPTKEEDITVPHLRSLLKNHIVGSFLKSISLNNQNDTSNNEENNHFDEWKDK